MFYYFGRKARLAPLYPEPQYDCIIEPFAGSMAFTLHHKPDSAIGIEIDANVHAVWHKMTALTADEIAAYPEPVEGERTFDRWSMMAAGSHGTSRASSYLWTERMSRDFKKQRRMAAANVGYAAGIDYRLGSYEMLPNYEATWFVDPPYQHKDRGYRREGLDYAALAEWCRTRKGLVIVCEQQGADWLPFTPLADIRGTTNKRTTEMVWCNEAVAEAVA